MIILYTIWYISDEVVFNFMSVNVGLKITNGAVY